MKRRSDPLASALDYANEISATDLYSVEGLFKIATPDNRSNDDCILFPDRLPSQLDDFLCCICKHIVNRGVEAKCCYHHFCAECVWEWLHACAKCLVCGHPLLASALAPLHPRLSGILAQVHVSCAFTKQTGLVVVQVYDSKISGYMLPTVLFGPEEHLTANYIE